MAVELLLSELEQVIRERGVDGLMDEMDRRLYELQQELEFTWAELLVSAEGLGGDSGAVMKQAAAPAA